MLSMNVKFNHPVGTNFIKTALPAIHFEMIVEDHTSFWPFGYVCLYDRPIFRPVGLNQFLTFLTTRVFSGTVSFFEATVEILLCCLFFQ